MADFELLEVHGHSESYKSFSWKKKTIKANKLTAYIQCICSKLLWRIKIFGMQSELDFVLSILFTFFLGLFLFLEKTYGPSLCH